MVSKERVGPAGLQRGLGAVGEGDAAGSAGEAVEQRADAAGALAALALGRGHHLLDHGARQALAGERRHVARVHADVQAVDMGVPDPRHHQGGGERGLPGGGAGQRQQQATIGHGALSLGRSVQA